MDSLESGIQRCCDFLAHLCLWPSPYLAEIFTVGLYQRDLAYQCRPVKLPLALSGGFQPSFGGHWRKTVLVVSLLELKPFKIFERNLSDFKPSCSWFTWTTNRTDGLCLGKPGWDAM